MNFSSYQLGTKVASDVIALQNPIVKQAMKKKAVSYLVGRGIAATIARNEVIEKSASAGAKAARDAIYRAAGEWLVKKSADGGTGMAHSVLAGLVGDKLMTTEERDDVQNSLSVNAGSMLDEDIIGKATENVSNKDAVRNALIKVLMQHNAVPAPAPVPAMPVTQYSPSIEQASAEGSVSQSENPGGLNEVVASALAGLKNQGLLP